MQNEKSRGILLCCPGVWFGIFALILSGSCNWLLHVWRINTPWCCCWWLYKALWTLENLDMVLAQSKCHLTISSVSILWWRIFANCNLGISSLWTTPREHAFWVFLHAQIPCGRAVLALNDRIGYHGMHSIVGSPVSNFYTHNIYGFLHMNAGDVVHAAAMSATDRVLKTWHLSRSCCWPNYLQPIWFRIPRV